MTISVLAEDQGGSSDLGAVRRSVTSVGADVVCCPRNPNWNKDYEHAVSQCEWIGICEYRGYEPKDDIGFYNPPTANFHLLKCLKGPNIGKELPVTFKFYDGGATLPPAGWKFSPDKMPERKSKWIIFLPNAVPVRGRGYDTFHGAFGRLSASGVELTELLAAKTGQTKENGQSIKLDDAAGTKLATVISAALALHGDPSNVAPATPAQTYSAHEDLLKLNLQQGKNVEIDAEYQWLLANAPKMRVDRGIQTEADYKLLLAQARPIADLHYGYAVFLDEQGKRKLAAGEYEQAAFYDGSNVEYVGKAGQVFFDLGQYSQAFQFLSRAAQLSGGEKFKNCFEACRKCLEKESQKSKHDRQNTTDPIYAPYDINYRSDCDFNQLHAVQDNPSFNGLSDKLHHSPTFLERPTDAEMWCVTLAH